MPPRAPQSRCLPPPSSRRRHADRHEGGTAARRAPEHRAGVERRGPAALLPDQRARRPALPARGPPALPVGRGRRGGPRSSRRRPAADGPRCGARSLAEPADRPVAARRPRGRRLDLPVVAELMRLAGRPATSIGPSHQVVTVLRDATAAELVAAWELVDHAARAARRVGRARRPPRRHAARRGILGRALARARRTHAADPSRARADPADPQASPRSPGHRRAPARWSSRSPAATGVVGRARSSAASPLADRDVELAGDRAAALGVLVGGAAAASRSPAPAPRRGAAPGRERPRQPARLDQIVSRTRRSRRGPVRGGPGRGRPAPADDGSRARPPVAAACRRPGSAALEEQRLASARDRRRRPHAIRSRRPRRSARAGPVRAAVVQEGFDTVCVAPLLDGRELLGVVDLHHDRPHRWSEDELDAAGRARDRGRVADPDGPELRPDGDLGGAAPVDPAARRAAHRPDRRPEIGSRSPPSCASSSTTTTSASTASTASDLIPVAMQGQVGEYVDETPDSCRSRSARASPAGWPSTACRRTCPDAAKDPRANTIPGTEDDLDESMLLAPMVFEDQVLGVVVLSKLGLHQFSDDDLRLLVIYASFAAQAMANADATERLRRAVGGARAPGPQPARAAADHRVDPDDARRPAPSSSRSPTGSGGSIAYDNIAIEVLDRATGLLRPLTARGVHADDYLEPWELGETGIATWVVEHNEPVLIVDESSDPRVNTFATPDRSDGCLIVVPLRGPRRRDRRADPRAAGRGASFAEDEFELVKLFAAQVSIALQNAEVYRAVEIRRPDRRPDRPAQPRHVPGVARAPRRRGRPVQPRDDGPRQLQARSTTRWATRPATGCFARSPPRSWRRAATPTSCSGTAATSSR